MSRPLVSIIIPTFNHASSLPKSVESCLAQTYDRLELIIVDDGSTDNTEDVVRPYLSDVRIRYVRKDHAERSAARNLGLDEAKGEFIQFLDADDLLRPEKIACQVDFLLSHSDVFVVSCVTDYAGADGKPCRSLRPTASGRITGELLMGNFIPIHAPLARRCGTRFDTGRSIVEDWKYWLFATKDKEVGIIDRTLCDVAVHGQDSFPYVKRIIICEAGVLLEFLRNPEFGQFRTVMVVSLLKRAFRLAKLHLSWLLGRV